MENNNKENIVSWQGGLENRPDWDTFFMSLAFLISQKSPDPRTTHGSVLVAEDRRILSVGYNGPVRGSLDKNIPLDSNDKYLHLLHAEENCLLNYNGSKEDLKNSTLYITGKYCHKCLRMILQKGIKNIVLGPVKSSCIDQNDEKASSEMIIGQNVIIKTYEDNEKIKSLLTKTIDYINYKKQ